MIHAGIKFPIFKIWWLREASQIGQTFTQHGRIAIDPAVLAAIGHRFIANKIETRNQRLYLPIQYNYIKQ